MEGFDFSNIDLRPWTIVGASIALHGIVFTLMHTIVSRTVFGGLYNKLGTREKMRFNERFVAMIHAMISCQGSIRAFFSILPDEITFQNIVEVSGAYAYDGEVRLTMEKWKLAETYLCVTLGYFLYDTIIYLFVSRQHPLMDLVHHFVSEGQYLMHIILRWGYFLPTCLQTNEISTPFIHMSWFAAQAGDHGYPRLGKLFPILQVVFGVLFLLSRILFNTALFSVTCYSLYYYLFVSDAVPKFAILASFINFMLYLIVQYFWFAAIYRKFISILKGNSSDAWKKDKNGKEKRAKKDE